MAFRSSGGAGGTRCRRWRRLVAPDLRGYDRSEKPTAISAYRTERLVGDVVGLIRSLGVERASVVGHDWGGVIAWHLAMTHPERVKRLAILNAPHPALLKRELATLGQLLRSWYVFFFQIPWLPEAVIRAGNFRALERAFRTSTVRPDVFSAAEIDRYKEALARPGALTAAINYYRASFREAWGARGFRPTPVPTLLIWGERDLALNVRFTQGLSDWVPDLRIERLPDVGHFVQHEAPDTVNRLLVEFLRG
jgi:pimeloyl-ACP methyl ester carboxylesterase